ncbi:uncharacterized protein LOC111633421 [Centruroides sculpturatus]|uniref:uncharacterized protein LOC111633421 n=1 Tax=Centruroides sculpturatus TaxID=218467 RepID=UPI000C6DC3CD|nr:uncharacterized protein LOC111633421 [Centruroides sculpturatus]
MEKKTIENLAKTLEYESRLSKSHAEKIKRDIRSGTFNTKKSRPIPDISCIYKDPFKDSELLKMKRKKELETEYKKRIKERIIQIQNMKEKVTPKCQCSKELPHENEYYQNIIRNSALSVPISPISVEWMNKIQSFIPMRLKRNPQMKEFLACEMLKFKDEYQIGMREAVVKTVINVKHKEEQINIIRSPLKIDEAWRNRFCNSLKLLNKKLHRMNRISYRILKICNKYLSTTTMLEFSERSLQHSMTISEMHEAIRRECNKAEFVLMDETWFHDIVKVLTNDMKKALSEYKGDTRESLLNCCNTLLSIKAKTVIEQTIEKYMLLFKDKLVVRSYKAPWKPVLKVSLIVINNEVSLNPTIVELQEAYLAVISIVNSSIKRLPVLQSVLKEITRPLKIKVSLDDETFNCKQTELKTSLEPFCNELQERIKYFESDILSNSAHRDSRNL